MTARPTIYVTPRPGRIVHLPGSGEELPPAGKAVEDASYWRRRARDKDVEIAATEPHRRRAGRKEGK